MSTTSLPISTIKNQWLFQHVDVKFPTQESLEGKALYEQKISGAEYRKWSRTSSKPDSVFAPEDVYLVDFHRLTVMFSILQSLKWSDEKERADVLEFFTQIILSDPCDLYVAFINGEAVASAIVTHSDEAILVSDIACHLEHISQLNLSEETVRNALVFGLIERAVQRNDSEIDVYIELM
ncbi:flavodoxin [uncultured Vibrio sp.]|uniref:flavodoxin n=1 Tax=uncultured Vibrio sp. TaxID=114054 RepID=UPI0025E41CC1|nr:flavodoxin [uncultured Vibrio sp.]